MHDWSQRKKKEEAHERRHTKCVQKGWNWKMFAAAREMIG
jgi:hypothetical protein